MLLPFVYFELYNSSSGTFLLAFGLIPPPQKSPQNFLPLKVQRRVKIETVSTFVSPVKAASCLTVDGHAGHQMNLLVDCTVDFILGT